AKDAIGARFRDEIPQERLRSVIERAAGIQRELLDARLKALSLDPSSLAVVRLRVERGAEYLSRLTPSDADRVVLRAVQSTSGLDRRAAQQLGVIRYGSGPDLRLTVYRRDDGMDPLRHPDPKALGEALRSSLGRELEAAARHYDTSGRGTVG